MSDSIAERQAERKRRELEPRDWDSYRRALIESGMVEEARLRRQADPLERAVASIVAGVANETIAALATPPHAEFGRTVIDALFEEKHGL